MLMLFLSYKALMYMDGHHSQTYNSLIAQLKMFRSDLLFITSHFCHCFSLLLIGYWLGCLDYYLGLLHLLTYLWYYYLVIFSTAHFDCSFASPRNNFCVACNPVAISFGNMHSHNPFTVQTGMSLYSMPFVSVRNDSETNFCRSRFKADWSIQYLAYSL